MAVDRQDLEQMLDNLRDMIQTGAREAAQDMLAQLQELLENLEDWSAEAARCSKVSR